MCYPLWLFSTFLKLYYCFVSFSKKGEGLPVLSSRAGNQKTFINNWGLDLEFRKWNKAIIQF
jgi:hypothetical protein